MRNVLKKRKSFLKKNTTGQVKEPTIKKYVLKQLKHPGGLYLFRGALDDAKQERIHIGNSDFSKLDFESNSLAVTLKDKDGRVKTSQGFVVYKKIPKNKTIDDFFGKESNSYSRYRTSVFTLLKITR